jgi:hypothetical protein
MAYKYKLVKEIKPAELEKAADTVGPYVMKDIIAKKLNYADFEELEKDLGDIGIEQNKIDQILDLWAERAQLMHMNEINSLNPVLAKITPDSDTDPEQEKINRNKGNNYMTPEERNMTPEERRKHREREDREEREKLKKQGEANLTKEVLRRLRNR